MADRWIESVFGDLRLIAAAGVANPQLLFARAVGAEADFVARRRILRRSVLRQSPASFTYGNTPATGAYGLRNPHFFNQDLTLSRNFQVRENLKFAFGADAFNMFNNVRFGSITTNITSASFGKVGAQVNLPRVFQFKLRVEF